MFPWAAPADRGVNDATNVTLSPGVSVVGSGRPLRPKPEPLAVPWVMVTGPAPELIRVAGRFWVFPICKFPKLTVEGAAVSLPTTAAVPETETTSEVAEAVVVAASYLPRAPGVHQRAKPLKFILPLALPVEEGGM